jgi:hypothetical protein
MRQKFDFDFITELKLNNGTFDILVQVTGYVPTRQAPPCNNPDSPAFSDCGDDPEFDDYKAHFYFSHPARTFFIGIPEELLDLVDEIMFDKICTKGDEIYWNEMLIEEKECNNE